MKPHKKDLQFFETKRQAILKTAREVFDVFVSPNTVKGKIIEAPPKCGKKDIEIAIVKLFRKNTLHDHIKFFHITKLPNIDTQPQLDELEQNGFEKNGAIRLLTKKQSKNFLKLLNSYEKNENYRAIVVIDECDYGSATSSCLDIIFQHILNDSRYQILVISATADEAVYGKYPKQWNELIEHNPPDNYRGANWFLKENLTEDAENFFEPDFSKHNVVLSTQAINACNKLINDYDKCFGIVRLTGNNKRDTETNENLKLKINNAKKNEWKGLHIPIKEALKKQLPSSVKDKYGRSEEIEWEVIVANQGNPFHWDDLTKEEMPKVENWYRCYEQHKGFEEVHVRKLFLIIIDMTAGRSTALGQLYKFKVDKNNIICKDEDNDRILIEAGVRLHNLISFWHDCPSSSTTYATAIQRFGRVFHFDDIGYRINLYADDEVLKKCAKLPCDMDRSLNARISREQKAGAQYIDVTYIKYGDVITQNNKQVGIKKLDGTFESWRDFKNLHIDENGKKHSPIRISNTATDNLARNILEKKTLGAYVRAKQLHEREFVILDGPFSKLKPWANSDKEYARPKDWHGEKAKYDFEQLLLNGYKIDEVYQMVPSEKTYDNNIYKTTSKSMYEK